MRKPITALAVWLTLTILPVCATEDNQILNGVPVKPGVQAVYAINVNGQRHLVTKLIDTRKFNGDRLWTYEVADSTYPVTISELAHDANKQILKDVPDFRPEEQRHPWLHRIEKYGPSVNTLLTFLELIL